MLSFSIFLIWNLLIISIPINGSARLYGETLFKETLGVELICDARRKQSSWVNPAKEVPLGKIYLINSWFFSIEPFCQEQLGSQ